MADFPVSPLLHASLCSLTRVSKCLCVSPTHGIRPDTSKTVKVKVFPTPCDVHQFIGLTSYFRRFVPNFSNVASPLRALTKKNAVFKWSTECQSAFERMKH